MAPFQDCTGLELPSVLAFLATRGGRFLAILG